MPALYPAVAGRDARRHARQVTPRSAGRAMVGGKAGIFVRAKPLRMIPRGGTRAPIAVISHVMNLRYIASVKKC
jgi:hypothetical protein